VATRRASSLAFLGTRSEPTRQRPLQGPTQSSSQTAGIRCASPSHCASPLHSRSHQSYCAPHHHRRPTQPSWQGAGRRCALPSAPLAPKTINANAFVPWFTSDIYHGALALFTISFFLMTPVSDLRRLSSDDSCVRPTSYVVSSDDACVRPTSYVVSRLMTPVLDLLRTSSDDSCVRPTSSLFVCRAG
jgi:hypothetical protein